MSKAAWIIAFFSVLFLVTPHRYGNKRFIYNIHCVDLNIFAYLKKRRAFIIFASFLIKRGVRLDAKKK